MKTQLYVSLISLFFALNCLAQSDEDVLFLEKIISEDVRLGQVSVARGIYENSNIRIVEFFDKVIYPKNIVLLDQESFESMARDLYGQNYDRQIQILSKQDDLFIYGVKTKSIILSASALKVFPKDQFSGFLLKEFVRLESGP